MPSGGWRLAYVAVLCASVIAPGSISPTPVAAGIPDQSNVASPRDVPSSATVTIDPGSRAFTPANITIAQGGTLTVYNRDSSRHSVTPAGKDTKVTFVNKLPTKTNVSVHFHGDHHSWTHDGQPTKFLIAQGKSRTYDYPIRDGGKPERASFEWYHDHRMAVTTRNNWRGLQGMFIVTDGQGSKL